LVVEDGAASATAADEVNWGVETGFREWIAIVIARGGVEEGEIHL
jgi:hypothetical protein